MTTTDDFTDLFAGRYDAHGSWTGGKQDGYPDYEAHLGNGPHIGVYCVNDNNECYWGCIDIDGKDFDSNWDNMWATAGNIQEALAYKQIKAWTERTTNGIHVWVFPAAPVPAAIMRHALLAACQVIDYLPKEVNPKQETLNPDKPYGNYVRLCYPGGLNGQPVDRFVIDEDGPMDLETFVTNACDERTDPVLLKEVAALYEPPPERKPMNLIADTKLIGELYPILPPVVKMIFDDGPLNGDRSSALVKTALILRDEGWEPQGVYWVLECLDSKLGKFVGREDREDQLATIVESYGVKH